MPCRSEYLQPTHYEIALSKIYSSLDEIKNGNYVNHKGHHPKAYCKGITQRDVDEKTEELCSKLQTLDVSKLSLETQMWWRDHQVVDKKRIMEEYRLSENKLKFIENLTPYEKKLLNLITQ